MQATAIVEVEVAADRCARLGRGVVGSEIHLLVLDAAPQTLDEDIVPPGALAVHADGNAIFDQHASECLAGELAALIRVEDFRLAVTSQSILQRLDAECRQGERLRYGRALIRSYRLEMAIEDEDMPLDE